MNVGGVTPGSGALNSAIRVRQINTYRGSAVDRSIFIRNTLPRVAGRSLAETDIEHLENKLDRQFGYLPCGDTENIASTGQFFWITQTGVAGCERLVVINLTEFIRQELDGEAEGARKVCVGSYDFSSSRATARMTGTILHIDNESGRTGCSIQHIDLATL